MRKSMRLIGKLYQWAMDGSKNNQEGSHHRRILKQTVLALHSLPRKHRQYTTLHSKTLFMLLSRDANRISLR